MRKNMGIAVIREVTDSDSKLTIMREVTGRAKAATFNKSLGISHRSEPSRASH